MPPNTLCVEFQPYLGLISFERKPFPSSEGRDVLSRLLALAACRHISPAITDCPSGPVSSTLLPINSFGQVSITGTENKCNAPCEAKCEFGGAFWSLYNINIQRPK